MRERERVRKREGIKEGERKRCRDKGERERVSGRERVESEKERRRGIEPAGQCKPLEYAG
jgi:hypothetical protein